MLVDRVLLPLVAVFFLELGHRRPCLTIRRHELARVLLKALIATEQFKCGVMITSHILQAFSFVESFTSNCVPHAVHINNSFVAIL